MAFNLAPITECQDRLQRDFTEFARLWSAVRESWKDERCRQFEQEHLQSVGPSLNRLSTSLQDFTDVVRKAEADLADPKEP